MKLCLDGGAYTYKRYDNFYDRIMRTIYYQIDVSGDDYKMEQRRLIWTTYRNINICFETYKNVFPIDKVFLHEKADKDRLVLGELFYFESQSNITLNLNESEVSTDGTSKLSGGRPLTNLSPSFIILFFVQGKNNIISSLTYFWAL